MNGTRLENNVALSEGSYTFYDLFTDLNVTGAHVVGDKISIISSTIHISDSDFSNEYEPIAPDESAKGGFINLFG